jgi:hypothetical protein
MVTVGDGETASLTIRMAEGADLYVRIKDPSGANAALVGKRPGASLLIGVRRSEREGLPIPMTAASDGSGYHIIVPPETLLVVKALSPYFALSDANGKAGSPQNGLEEAVTIERNASKEVVFTISGLVSW